MLNESAQLAYDTILQRPTRGIPCWMLHIMRHEHLERLAGVEPGAYVQQPDAVYLAAQRAAGVCMIDQYLATNPMTMTPTGYDPAAGIKPNANRNLLDGWPITTPEEVVEHLERCVFPALAAQIAEFDEDRRTAEIIAGERAMQETFGPDILKAGYSFAGFPGLAYGGYGYEPYFMAYALYPDVIERHFALQADLALLNNRAAARAYVEGALPPFYRLDHDMADSRGTLVDVRSLDRLWFPHFARCLQPLLQAGIRLIWHCDGNLMQMVPRLLEVGIRGFQGFQYEDGMDYERICKLRAQDGEELIIIAGVSVTRTLPFGTPADVRREIDFLVAHGPRRGLFLGASSTITPDTPWSNLQALVEGVAYYRRYGR